MVRHKVEDFGRWKAAFDRSLDQRHVCGHKASRLFDVDVDGSSVVVYSQWDSIERARSFVESEELKEAMKQEGFSERPDFYFLKEVPLEERA
jgi:heme-degrading monooxygenase HmoA